MKKKLLLVGLCVCTLMANAESFTLDLATATDMNSKPIQFETKDILVYNGNLKDVWDSTYSANGIYQFIYSNKAKYMFSHLSGGNGGWSTYYDGFTISKNASDTLNQFGCMAKGGRKGIGTPFAVGYYSTYYTSTPNLILFDNEYYPTEIYICQSAFTYSSIMNGDGFARKFTDKDTLALIISAYDGVLTTEQSITYYLAINGNFNKSWTKVDLSPLGKCYGLNFSMTSTDVGTYGINTPLYFCLDELTISTTPSAALSNQVIEQNTTKRLINGQLFIERDGHLFDVTGRCVK